MAKERQPTSTEARARAVAEIREGRSRKEVAAELGVALATVHLWMAKANAQPPAAHQPILPPSQVADEKYVEGLKMRIRQLEVDVKYLKEKLALYEGGE